MFDPSLDPFNPEARGHWIRLRTLTVLRWVAIAGQIGALIVGLEVFDLKLDLGLCYLAIGLSVVANIFATFLFPGNKRLSEGEVVLMLLFDIGQLAFLLYLTGGLHNPFALLILAPVTISASALQLRSTVFLAVASVVMVSIVALYNMPLQTQGGRMMRVPQDFLFGYWVALVIGVTFIAVYARRVSHEIHAMADALLATQMALVREQKLTDLGGVVAAAAHELGTPLATIKLVSSELMGELDDAALRDDARLIRDQADRCRDILRSMGRAGKDDMLLHRAPLDTVIREAAEPHSARGRKLHFTIEPAEGGEAEQPQVLRKPEVIHGIRNLVQNAVDFAVANVWIEATWTATTIRVRITDDGAGFPPQLIGRLGDPLLRKRRSDTDRVQRAEYEGMGLGLFIAKTLLERTGAQLAFSNGSDPFLDPHERPERGGAIVDVVWPRARIATAPTEGRVVLGKNQPIRA